jgi:hypothetical protein
MDKVIKFIEKYINDPRIKSIEILGWQECGDFMGDDIRPLLKIEKNKGNWAKTHENEINNGDQLKLWRKK